MNNITNRRNGHAVGCAEKQNNRLLSQESVAGELAGARTRDPNIKSVVLYLLSYEFIVPIRGIPRFWWCKCRHYFCYTKIISCFLSPFAANRQLLFPETCFV